MVMNGIPEYSLLLGPMNQTDPVLDLIKNLTTLLSFDTEANEFDFQYRYIS